MQTKKDRIKLLLTRIEESCDELLEESSLEDMSDEEVLVLATEMTLGTPVTSIEYGHPIGMVDKTKVSFMLDDEFEFPLYGEQDDED